MENRDFKDFKASEGPFLGQKNFCQTTVLAALLFSHHFLVRTQWTATPADVNAYYSRNRNQIMFPAGILQPPFYHKHFPKSLNFGGIGVVIGHEITHGFDDKGRQFDHQGNINQWWDQDSSDNFHQRAQCMISEWIKISILIQHSRYF